MRSNEYTGINYAGNVAIDIETVTNGKSLFINDSMDNYSVLGSTIKKKGSVAGVQVACFNSKYNAQSNWKNNNSADYIDFVKYKIGSLNVSQIN